MIDPDARALLELIEQRGIPEMHTLLPTEARKLYRERRFFTQPAPPHVASVRDVHGPVPLRIYRPRGPGDDTLLPVLVYFHGGGWTIGDLDTHDVLCRELCNGSGACVVSVDYRLGPEHRFPAAVDDAIAATRWVAAHAAELKVDAKRLAVGGDSAGGNLAAVVAISARGLGRHPVSTSCVDAPGEGAVEIGNGCLIARLSAVAWDAEGQGGAGASPHSPPAIAGPPATPNSQTASGGRRPQCRPVLNESDQAPP